MDRRGTNFKFWLLAMTLSRVSSYTDGLVLSDMHLLHPACSEFTTTAFAYASHQPDEPGLTPAGSGDASAKEAEHGCFDADGDRVVKRRRGRGHGEVLVRHECETPLAGVGMQIWRGALLLADYVHHRSASLRGATVLELGCGCALTGLLAARFASHVVLTDSPVRVLNPAGIVVVTHSVIVVVTHRSARSPQALPSFIIILINSRRCTRPAYLSFLRFACSTTRCTTSR